MTFATRRRATPSPADAGTAAPSGVPAQHPPGLRAHLVTLVLAVLLPALAFGFAASWEALRRQDAAAEARLLDTARALSAAVDARLGGQIAACHDANAE